MGSAGARNRFIAVALLLAALVLVAYGYQATSRALLPVPRHLLLLCSGGAGLLLLAAIIYLLAGGISRHAEAEADKRSGLFDIDAVFEATVVGLALVNKEEKIVRANKVLRDMLGYSETEFNGMAFHRISHLSDINTDRALLIDVLEGRAPRYEIEKRLMTKGGVTRWAQISAIGLPQIEGGGRGALILIEDCTHHREAERALRASRQAMQNLYEVVAAEHVDFAEKMHSLLELGCKQFGLETGVLGRVRDGSFEVKQVVSSDPTIRRGDVYDIGASELHETNGSQPPAGLPSNGLPDDWRNLPSYCETETEAYLGAPIMVNGQMYGTLNFSSPEPRAEPFEESDVQFLKLMAQWVGSEIGRRQAQAELQAKQLELAAANKQLEALATHDGLTGVKNRRAFNEQLDVEYRRALRYGTPLSLILLDVDKFKQYNDTFGHPAGDAVLKQVASILQGGVRNIDYVARYGGEEFVILAPNTDATGAMILAERLRAKIETGKWTQRDVTASFGVATLEQHMAEAAALTSSADQALYHSKEEGRNRVTHVHTLDPEVVFRS